MAALLRVERLEKRFGTRRVLADVQLHLEPGAAALLVGPNGSGKTTLLRILATLSRPTSGRVLIGTDDTEGAQQGAAVRRRLGYLAHQPLVWDDLTGRENLSLVARLAGLGRGAALNAAATWLGRLGLAGWADDRAGTYSRGMKQRLALARALVAAPDVLLLDEPTANLDAASRRLVWEILAQVKGQATIMVAAHDPEADAAWTDRTYRLEDGRLTEAAG